MPTERVWTYTELINSNNVNLCKLLVPQPRVYKIQHYQWMKLLINNKAKCVDCIYNCRLNFCDRTYEYIYVPIPKKLRYLLTASVYDWICELCNYVNVTTSIHCKQCKNLFNSHCIVILGEKEQITYNDICNSN